MNRRRFVKSVLASAPVVGASMVMGSNEGGELLEVKPLEGAQAFGIDVYVTDFSHFLYLAPDYGSARAWLKSFVGLVDNFGEVCHKDFRRFGYFLPREYLGDNFWAGGTEGTSYYYVNNTWGRVPLRRLQQVRLGSRVGTLRTDHEVNFGFRDGAPPVYNGSVDERRRFWESLTDGSLYWRYGGTSGRELPIRIMVVAR